MSLTFGSLFSGIGGIDLGLERAGWTCAWQVEIDAYRRRVLARHWPDVRRYEDVRECQGIQSLSDDDSEGRVGRGLQGRQRSRRADSPRAAQGAAAHLEPVDLICGGFPCQDLSVAGRRAGLRAPRSGLFFEFARIVGEVRPVWILVENVPGLLSSNGGDDFRIVADTLQGFGYGLAWRILDSRHFGVPQRRRRVYIVGSLGSLSCAAVLFEPEGGGGHPAPGGEAREGVAAPLGSSVTSSGGHRNDLDNETYVCESRSRGGEPRFFSMPNLRAAYGDGKGGQRVPFICAPPDTDGVRAAPGVPRRLDARPVAVRPAQTGSHGWGILDDGTTHALDSSGSAPDFVGPVAEPAGQDGAEGVQGDDARPCCPDGPRYAALGDAVTVAVAEWIGRRIRRSVQVSK